MYTNASLKAISPKWFYTSLSSSIDTKIIRLSWSLFVSTFFFFSHEEHKEHVVDVMKIFSKMFNVASLLLDPYIGTFQKVAVCLFCVLGGTRPFYRFLYHG